jgi:hypothetical protein
MYRIATACGGSSVATKGDAIVQVYDTHYHENAQISAAPTGRPACAG